MRTFSAIELGRELASSIIVSSISIDLNRGRLFVSNFSMASGNLWKCVEMRAIFCLMDASSNASLLD